MSNDDDWVNDVRRWYFGGHPPEGEFTADDIAAQDEHALGFDAASPVFHGSRWPDALVPGAN